jgi:hypothetical protein
LFSLTIKAEKEAVDKKVLPTMQSGFNSWCGSVCVPPTSATVKTTKVAKRNMEIM